MPDAVAAPQTIEGQLSSAERELLTRAITEAPKKPQVVIEVGTWLGGGSTLHILRALERNGTGRLWGIETDRAIFERMMANLRAAVPTEVARFTPLFGRSEEVIPQWLRERGAELEVDFVFLDGGERPLEQVTEFNLLDPFIPVGGQLMSHDARWRKGKWFVPYISRLDHWQCQIIDASEVGLLHGVKRAARPSPESLRAARAHLRKLRLSPVEIIGAILPRQVCYAILRRLSPRAIRSLGRI